jgi:putative flippase GtrA
MPRISRTRKDLKYSLISGLLTGFIIWRLTVFLDIPEFFEIPYFYAVFIVPVVWFLGVNFGYFLGQWLSPFNQFGRFAAVGFTNAAVDFGILNSLIFLTSIDQGFWFSVFKATSFFVALLNSYYFNKYWTFEAGRSGGGAREFTGFTGVVVLAAFVNVGVASFVVNLIDPVAGLGSEAWANVGAIAGSAAALLFSFTGFRRVFGKR